jgi:excisionase family DNA binding protein
MEKRTLTGARPSPSAPLAVSPREAGRLLSLGQSRIYNLMRAGELQNYEDGRSRRILLTSIHDYVARRIAASADGWQQWEHSPPKLKAAARPKRRTRVDQPELEAG